MKLLSYQGTAGAVFSMGFVHSLCEVGRFRERLGYTVISSACIRYNAGGFPYVTLRLGNTFGPKDCHEGVCVLPLVYAYRG